MPAGVRNSGCLAEDHFYARADHFHATGLDRFARNIRPAGLAVFVGHPEDRPAVFVADWAPLFVVLKDQRSRDLSVRFAETLLHAPDGRVCQVMPPHQQLACDDRRLLCTFVLAGLTKDERAELAFLLRCQLQSAE
jgi:hypothetical protein